MSTCANCPEDAVFCVSDPGAVPVEYCRNCLPAHLVGRSDLGHLPLLDEADDPDDAPVTTAAVKKRK